MAQENAKTAVKSKDAETQWVKLHKDYDGHAKDSVVEMDKDEAATLIKADMCSAVEEPEEVKGKMADLAAGIDERIATAVDAMGDKLVKSLSVKVGNRKRPVISSVVDNEDSDPKMGFKHAGEFYKAVYQAEALKRVDPRLLRTKAPAGGSEGDSGLGGYATPVYYAMNVWDDLVSQISLMGRCELIPMLSNSIKLPALNYVSQGNPGAGIVTYWEAEGANIPTSANNYRQPQLTLNKLTALCPVTDELLEDGLMIESTLNRTTNEELTFKITDGIVRGTGAGQPSGFLTHPSTVVVARANNNEVAYTDVFKMRSSLAAKNMGKPVWLANQDVFPALYGMTDGSGRLVYNPWDQSFAEAIRGAETDVAPAYAGGSLFGLPVIALPNMNSLQASPSFGDLALWDGKGYALGYKSAGVQKAMSIHLYFASAQTAFRTIVRIDGRPWRDAPLAAANGPATYSEAVVLGPAA